MQLESLNETQEVISRKQNFRKTRRRAPNVEDSSQRKYDSGLMTRFKEFRRLTLNRRRTSMPATDRCRIFHSHGLNEKRYAKCAYDELTAINGFCWGHQMEGVRTGP